MRIAVITDIHHRSGGPAEVLDAVRNFVEQANADGADLLLDLGDRLRDASPELDHEALRELAGIFSRFDGERFHLLGNHDVINLTVADHAALLGVPIRTRTFSRDDLTVVAWQPDVTLLEPHGFAPAGDALADLASALEAATGPTIVATHYPVSGQSMIGNPYFEREPGWAFPPDHEQVRALLAGTGNCVLWLSGHIHQTTWTRIGRTAHVCLQSLSENIGGRPSLATALCDVDHDITLAVSGRDPLLLKSPIGIY